MDADRAALLRELLGQDPLVDDARAFARTLRQSSTTPGGLVLVGTPDQEPWHLTAHIADEARFAGAPELEPTLVRWSPPTDAPAHLAIGLERLERAGRGETVFVVAPDRAPDPLLERIADAKKTGATILAMDSGDRELESLAHDALIVSATPTTPISVRFDRDTRASHELFLASGNDLLFDTAQHLVSLSVADPHSSSTRLSPRERLARFLDSLTGAPAKW